MLAIRLPQEIEKRLSKLAERTGRTKTYYAREAIVRYLEDLEDTYLAIDRLVWIIQTQAPRRAHPHPSLAVDLEGEERGVGKPVAGRVGLPGLAVEAGHSHSLQKPDIA